MQKIQNWILKKDEGSNNFQFYFLSNMISRDVGTATLGSSNNVGFPIKREYISVSNFVSGSLITTEVILWYNWQF